MGKLKELWERLKSWVNGGSVKRIGYETDEQALDAFVDKETKEIMEALNNPIISPDEKRALEAKLKEKMKEAVKAGVEPENKSVEEIKDEQEENKIEDNGTKTIEQVEEESKKIDPKNIGYMDRLAILHNMKMRLYKEQEAEQRGVTDLKYTELVMRYEKMLLDERENYVASLSDEEKNKFKEEEAKLKLQELKAQKQAEEKYIDRYNQFSRIVGDIKRIREEKEAAMARFRDGNIDQEECNKLKSIADDDLEIALIAMAKLKPEELLEDVKNIEERETMQEKILGGDYRSKQIAKATAELASKIEESHERDKEGAAEITSVETYFQMYGVHEMTEDLERHLEELNKELDKVQEDLDKGNISSEKLKRAEELLKEVEGVQEEVRQYEGVEEIATMRSAPLDTAAHESLSEIEANSNKLDEKYQNTEATIEQIAKKEGEEIVENPNNIDSINEGKEEKTDDPMGLGDLVNVVPDTGAIERKAALDAELERQAKEDLKEMRNGVKVRRPN